MSSGQLARTPENFPRMKHRAAGRIAKRWAKQRFQWLITGFAGGGFMSGSGPACGAAPGKLGPPRARD